MSIQIKIGADVSGVNAAIQDATKSLNTLKAPAANAQNALFSLTQVARDLPFGFIAIQNNLPLVFDQFSRLTKESGGLLNGLKSLGTALIGPAGFSFAISVIITGITNLVQEYGSLGNALKALTGQALSATDVQNKYNKASEDAIKNSASERANLESLASILTSTTSSREQQEGAFQRINKEYPGLLANLNKEQLLNGVLNTTLASRIKLFTKQIELEGRKDALVKLIGEASIAGEKALKNLTDIDDLGFFDQLTLQFKALAQGLGQTGAAGGVLALTNELKSSKTEVNAYSNNLNLVNGELTAIDVQINKLIQDQKAQTKSLSESINENERLKKQKISEEVERQRNGWKAIGQEVNEYYATLKNIIASNDKIAKTKANIQQEQAALNTKKALEEQAKAAKQAEIAFFDLADAEMATGTTAVKDPLASIKNLAPEIQKYTNFQFITEGIKSTLTDPLSDLFTNFLETGKFTFKEFASVILATVKKLVAQLIATGILKLLTNILFPGAGGVAGGAAAGGGGFLGGLVKGIGSLFGGGGVAAPQFSGVQAGGFGLNGQVVFRQSGSDLVGVLNRTNATINRVG